MSTDTVLRVQCCTLEPNLTLQKYKYNLVQFGELTTHLYFNRNPSCDDKTSCEKDKACKKHCVEFETQETVENNLTTSSVY